MIVSDSNLLEYIFQNTTPSKFPEVASALLEIFKQQSRIPDLIVTCVNREISRTGKNNTLPQR